jgi:hypothetical protein
MGKEIPVGYCQCGCGGTTKVSLQDRKKDGHVKGVPVRFIKGHNGRGAGNGMYKGGICFSNSQGRYLTDRGDGVFITRARKIMQDHLGRPLSLSEVVHHINGDPKDDRIENLQLMTRSEHMKHHGIQRPECKRR